MSNETTASFIAASLAQAIWSGRVWPDVARVPELARDLAYAARFAPHAQAARMFEERLLPLLPPTVRQALDTLASDLYAWEPAGEAIWHLIHALSLQAEAARMQEEATTYLLNEMEATRA